MSEPPDELLRCATRWGVELAEPPVQGIGGWVAFGRRHELPVVVKAARRSPHPSEAAARALELWDGRGAVRLLDFDAETATFLLEAAVPGTTMSAALGDEERDEAVVRGLAQLWISAPELAGHVPTVAHRLSSARQVVAAHLLASSSRELHRCAETCLTLMDQRVVGDHERLLHGDPKPENFVLSRRGWLAIDPIPMIGDPAFEVARYLSIPQPGRELPERVRRLGPLHEVEPRSLSRVLFVVLCHALAWHVAQHDQDMIESRLAALDSISALAEIGEQ